MNKQAEEEIEGDFNVIIWLMFIVLGYFILVGTCG